MRQLSAGAALVGRAARRGGIVAGFRAGGMACGLLEPARLAGSFFDEGVNAKALRGVAAAWGSGSAYTPCFVRDGEEWRVRGATPEDSARGQPAGEQVVAPVAGGSWRADYTAADTARSDLTVHVAALGGGFVSKVTAGGNRGVTLR